MRGPVCNMKPSLLWLILSWWRSCSRRTILELPCDRLEFVLFTESPCFPNFGLVSADVATLEPPLGPSPRICYSVGLSTDYCSIRPLLLGCIFPAASIPLLSIMSSPDMLYTLEWAAVPLFDPFTPPNFSFYCLLELVRILPKFYVESESTTFYWVLLSPAFLRLCLDALLPS